MLKLLLRYLHIFVSSQSFIDFLRSGNFESSQAHRWLAQFKSSRLDLVETNPQAYFLMLEALASADNLGSVQLQKIGIDQY